MQGVTGDDVAACILEHGGVDMYLQQFVHDMVSERRKNVVLG